MTKSPQEMAEEYQNEYFRGNIPKDYDTIKNAFLAGHAAALESPAVKGLVEALKLIQSCNKNDGNAPKDNRGPESKAYWHWQEMISRDVAWKALAAYEESFK